MLCYCLALPENLQDARNGHLLRTWSVCDCREDKVAMQIRMQVKSTGHVRLVAHYRVVDTYIRLVGASKRRKDLDFFAISVP